MKPMIIPYNEKAFTPEEAKAGMVGEFVDFLVKQDAKSNEVKERSHTGGYTNINIINDSYCVIVQWCDVFFNDDSPKFEFVNEGETVATVLELPDNSTILCWDEDDAQEYLDEFLKEHPYYKKNKYGHWYDENEQKEWEEWIKKNHPTIEDLDKENAEKHGITLDTEYDIVNCTANDEQGENCDNQCDTCEYNTNNKYERIDSFENPNINTNINSSEEI